VYYQHGAHRHPNNEVNLTTLEVTTIRSPRGLEMIKRYRLHLSGELLAVGQAALSTAIAELIDAYTLFDPDVTSGLYHDDGTPTRHRIESSLINSANISGVRMAYRSWPKGEPEEYATGREFYIILEAEYRDLEGQIINYHEHVRKRGTCGPYVNYTEFQTGLARLEVINQQTVQDIVQEGYAVGFDGYVYPNGPGAIFPALEIPTLRVIDPESPEFMGRAFAYYRTNWRYVMQSNVDQTNAFPRIV
jgi:hypothetical protein